MQKILSKTKNGKIFKCCSCKKNHIEYKNLNFNLSNDELKEFAIYIAELKGSVLENINKDTPYNRKVVINLGHKNFNILLNCEELKELKQLFKTQDSDKQPYHFLHLQEMEFINYLN